MAETKIPRVALAGNPNCGKTLLFNTLTGLSYKVANYPGVTVEKKEAFIALPSGKAASVIDLPGTYDLCGTALDEQLVGKVVFGEIKGEPIPDLIISVVDATNLERNLYLVSQLIDSGIPVIVALTMIDLAQKEGYTIYSENLSRSLGVPVVPIVAARRKGIEELKLEIDKCLLKGTPSAKVHAWLESGCHFDRAVRSIGSALKSPTDNPNLVFLRASALIGDVYGITDPEIRSYVEKERASLSSDGIDPLTFEASRRYGWIRKVVSSTLVDSRAGRVSITQKIDGILLHKIWGLAFFTLLMGVLFQGIFTFAALPMDAIDSAVNATAEYMGTMIPKGLLNSLVTDGIIAGVGSVLVFIPQIAILFFFIGLLEDSGYLARSAYIMDRVMRRCGLQGRSFIPLLNSFACAIPGILSTRTIPSQADRLATILVSPLMSCSARLPVYTVLIAAVIPNRYYYGLVSVQGLVMLGMYILGIVGAAAVSWCLKKTLLKREPALFVMEMPPYRLPRLRSILRSVWDRVWAFIQNAGTIILACCVILWFLASFPKGDSNEASIRSSYAGMIGHAMEPVIEPLGYNWELGVAILASFAAREVFVSSLATVYNVEAGDETSSSLVTLLRERHEEGAFSVPTGLSLMVFYVFACQCISTLAVCKRETGSWWWTGFMFVYLTAIAYGAAFITYHGALRFYA